MTKRQKPREPSLTRVPSTRTVEYVCLSCNEKFGGPPGPVTCPFCQHLYVRKI